MGYLLQCLAACAAVTLAFEVPLASTRRVKKEWRVANYNLDSNTPISFTLVLHGQNMEVLDDHVRTVSDPASESYGKYWSLQQVAEKFGAHPDAVAAVVAWAGESLHATHIAVTKARDFVDITTTVGQLQRVLQCQFQLFKHGTQGDITRIRTQSKITLPSAISSHVRLALGLTDFLSPPRQRRMYDSLTSASSTSGDEDVAPVVGPRDVWDAYNIRYTGSKKSTVAVSAFEGQYISDSDLKTFLHMHGLPQNTYTLIGNNNQSEPGGESTLDIQTIMGVAPGLSHFFHYVGGKGPAKPPGNGAYILEWAKEVANMADPPLVTSHSYGDTEQGYYEKFGSYIYIEECESQFAKMALRGLTSVGGSGDAGYTNVGEAGNDISDTDPDCSVARPFYPSNSAYVVSVSATYFTPRSTPFCEDVPSGLPACTLPAEAPCSYKRIAHYTTGGGFSTIRPRQWWQKDVVEKYVSDVLPNTPLTPPSDQFDASGRGYPDVSAIGLNYMCVVGSKVSPIGGTSLAGPMVAAIIGLLNSIQLDAGQPPLGAPHAWLYNLYGSNPEAFNDVVVGDNADGVRQGAGSSYPSTCPNGFVAAPGWDAATGLGSLDFAQIIKHLPRK